MTYKVTSRSEQDTIELAQNIESEKISKYGNLFTR